MTSKKGRPDWYFLEYAMDWGGSFYRGTSGKELHGYANIAPLVKAGYVVLDREVVRDFGKELFFRPTPEGIRWWINHRVIEAGEVDPAVFMDKVEGKGIGSIIEFNTHYKAIWLALQRGYFDFVSHRDYCGMPHSFEEYVTVSLTAKGMKYFDSLQRLEMECA